MNLADALQLIAEQTGFDAQTLKSYADEDTLGGWHNVFEHEKFPCGSIWGVEGQVLYALTRALKPKRVAEIGAWHGCSASHLALAIQKNGRGDVISIDDGSEIGHVGTHGDMMPEHLRPSVKLVPSDGVAWLTKQPDASIDLLFEDDNHRADIVETVSRLALTKLRAGGILVDHDAADHPTGVEIRKGMDAAGIDYRVYLIEPSDCGLAIWRKERAK